MSYLKLKKISDRHQKGIVAASLYELFIRLYRMPWFRLIVRRFYRVKKPQRVVFVVGCYNAGTTVVKDAIGLHNSIATMPIEGDLLTGQMSNLEGGGWARCLYGNKESIMSSARSSELDLIEILKDWSPWIRTDKVFMDKAIAHSCRINQLRNTFGDRCKFIVVTRNKDDVVTGIQKRSAPSGDARAQLGQDNYPTELLEHQWEFIYKLIAEDARLEDSFVVAYEDFMENPALVTSDALMFLGLQEADVVLKADRLHLGVKSIPVRTGKPQDKVRLSNLHQLQSVCSSL